MKQKVRAVQFNRNPISMLHQSRVTEVPICNNSCNLLVEEAGDDFSLYPKEVYIPKYYVEEDDGTFGEYGFFMETIRAVKDKGKIEAIFKRIFGRTPSFKEVYRVAEAYEWNKSHLGARLRNPKFVKWVQSAINLIIGNKIKEDGIFGYETIIGLMKAQQLKGLKANGYLDYPTFELLRSVKSSEGLTLAKEDLFTSDTNKKFWLYLIAGMAVAGFVTYLFLKNRE